MTELASAPWWLWVPAAVGVLALLSVLAHLVPLGRPGEVLLTDAPPVGGRDFLEALSGVANAPLRTGGRAALLNDGDEIYPALHEAIAESRVSVNVMAYVWRPGKVSARTFDLLVGCARRGVEVRVLLDGFGGRKTPRDEIARLREAGGRVAWFRPLKPGTITRFHRRNHRRAIVIDGRIGFTGGAAFADDWLGCAQDPDHWRDSMVRVTGPPARTLQGAFAELWAHTCGEILVGDLFYPAVRGDAEGEPITHHVGVTSSPGGEDHPLRMVYLLSFLAARERLYVATSYFVPDRSLLRALEDRAGAGVDVRLLLPGVYCDAKPVRWAGQRHFHRLLSAGVRIYEYRTTMMHLKSVMVDRVWSLLGSANLNQRSWRLDDENLLGIHDAEFGAALEERFLVDLEQADEIVLARWRRRGLGPRVRERLAGLFARVF